ncbi:MAG TPA: hypothetical protein VJT09_12075 [Pyrinomonadaceae bacterium]|nr:hypothetical protein [Pyrinomonadaceae bacterium]
MRWIVRRTVFVLCFALGTTTWYILAQQGKPFVTTAPPAEEATVNQKNIPPDSDCAAAEDAAAIPGQSIKFGPVEPLYGTANRRKIVLRESADPSSAIVARVEAGNYETAMILDWTRDAMRVRFEANEGSADDTAVRTQSYEGWTTWDAVVPLASAVVFDAETGEVVARVPLGEGASSVIYSPDGSRAIFKSAGSEGGQTSYEVRMSDFKLTRSLRSSESEYVGALFYGPADGALYATIHWLDSSPLGKENHAGLFRIGEEGAPNALMDLEINEGAGVLSRDGLLWFFARPKSPGEDRLTVDVVELSTLTVRNTFTLFGENVPSNANGFVLSPDGSELYERLYENTGVISVVDTRTGQVVRELPESATEGWSYYSQDDLIGDSLLLRVSNDGAGEMHESYGTYWVGSSGRALAQKGISRAVETGGKRYAVNEDGTRLFKLDEKNRIRERLPIARPEVFKGGKGAEGMSVFGLSATPDGKRIIMLLGFEHGC